MFDTTYPETYWLTLTNIALGVVTLICLVAVGRVFLREVAERVRTRVHVPALQDDHSFVFGDLGITMADGGQPIDEKELYSKNSDETDPNIVRSEN